MSDHARSDPAPAGARAAREPGRPESGRMPELREVPSDLERLGRLMDSAVRLPGGYRIGLDGLIGLVPGVGDVAGAIVSLYIVLRARKLGVSRGTLVRMLLNVGLETVIGSVPVIGDLFDFAFKANLRNLALLRRMLEDPRSP